jgi:hypothetical protein
MARLSFIILLFALIVPRAAWGAHMAGHEEISTTAVHQHHDVDYHSHGEVDGEISEPLNLNDAGGIAHNHTPADVLSSIDVPDIGGSSGEIRYWPESHAMDLRSHWFPSPAPPSLLRPPRTA